MIEGRAKDERRMSEGWMRHEPVGASPYMGERAGKWAGGPNVGGSEKEAEKWGRPYLAVLVGFGGGGKRPCWSRLAGDGLII